MNNRDVEVCRAHEPRTEAQEEQLRVPATDVYETPDAFVVMMDLPGATRESVKLTLEKGEMRVKAGAGFYRAFTIGEGIDMGKVDARFEQGVLTVKLYKSEAMKPRSIQVN
jgi:HSP20 family protein